MRPTGHCCGSGRAVGLDQLCKVPNTDLSKMAAIGYCFGGLAVLEMARDGQNDLGGVVSFHGVLATPTPLKANTYHGKILVLHGVDDPVVPDDQTMAFWKEMRDAKANWEFVAYGNALHTFTNWLMPEDGLPPAVYNKQADRRSWIAMQDFFKEIFAYIVQLLFLIVQAIDRRLRTRIAAASVSCTSASQQLFDCDRQVAYSLAGRVIDGVRDRGRHGHGGQLAEALCAQRACFLVELADEQDVELGDVGVGRHEIAGIVAVEEAAQSLGSVSDCSSRAWPTPQMMPPIAWLRAVLGLMIRPAS